MAIKIYQVSFEHSLSFAEAASTMAAYGSKEWHTKKHKKQKTNTHETIMTSYYTSNILDNLHYFTKLQYCQYCNILICLGILRLWFFSVFFFDCLVEWERHAMANTFIHGINKSLDL